MKQLIKSFLIVKKTRGPNITESDLEFAKKI